MTKVTNWFEQCPLARDQGRESNRNNSWQPPTHLIKYAKIGKQMQAQYRTNQQHIDKISNMKTD